MKNNTGNRNAGNRNTGSCNTGSCNTGDRNTGSCNTGSCNTGDRNTGSCNTGNRNTGDRNTGSCNTGNRNTGSCNTGSWNAGNRNTGFFNTSTPDKINVFDAPTNICEWDKCDKPDFIYFSLTKWVPVSEMTQNEKDDNPGFGNTEGYLKKLDYKEEFKKSYSEASEEDRNKIFNVPNFDADKFLEISGIDVRINKEKETKKAELIAKAEELLEQARKM